MNFSHSIDPSEANHLDVAAARILLATVILVRHDSLADLVQERAVRVDDDQPPRHDDPDGDRARLLLFRRGRAPIVRRRPDDEKDQGDDLPQDGDEDRAAMVPDGAPDHEEVEEDGDGQAGDGPRVLGSVPNGGPDEAEDHQYQRHEADEDSGLAAVAAAKDPMALLFGARLGDEGGVVDHD